MFYPEGYKFRLAIQLRWSDMDMMQHLNNAKFITFLELSRVDYFKEVIGSAVVNNELNVILARTEIDYKAPVTLGDELVIFTRTSRIGYKSFDMEYELWINPETRLALAASARTVLVGYDYVIGTSVLLPEKWKELLTTYEASSSPTR